MISPKQHEEELESLANKAQAKLETCRKNYQVEIEKLQGSTLEHKKKHEEAESAIRSLQQQHDNVKSLNNQLLEFRRNVKEDKEKDKVTIEREKQLKDRNDQLNEHV